MNTEVYQKVERRGFDSRYISQLKTNYYRSPACLFEASNSLFYHRELTKPTGWTESESLKMSNWKGLPTKGYPLIFHPTFGNQSSNRANNGSWLNEKEATTVIEYIYKLLDDSSVNEKHNYCYN